ncbi:hypothetical protein GCM10023147_41210 [Tsukamurella soli]|uniref:Threonine/serine exporter n=1 Tax=Tsukamurella soli TaxID=644556 RepID=A0ABP8K7F3_9ACTN
MLDEDGARLRVDALLRLALGLIESGHPGSGALDIALSCARALGIGDVVIVDLGRTLSLQYLLPDGESVIRTGTAATFGTVDCRAMKRLHRLVADVVVGRIGADALPGALDDVLERPGPPLWWSVAGMTVLAFAVAWQVGVGARAAAVAAVLQVASSLVGALAARLGIPRVFGAATQALLCGPLIVAAHAIGVVTWVDAAACVGVPWMLIVPLPVLVATVVDAVAERYGAATARAFVVVLTSGGLALGALVVVQLGARLDIGGSRDLTLPVLPIALGLLFSAIGAMANAMANGGGRDLLIPAAVIGVFTAGVNLVLVHAVGLPADWATFGAAVTLGFVSAVWSRFVPYPAAVLALLGITGALLPGLTVYLGIAHEVFRASGGPQFLAAAVTGVGLGVGVALGERLSRVVPGPVVQDD